MVLSENELFKVSIINTKQDKAYLEYTSPEYKTYISITIKDEFIIKVESMKEINKHYGCMLFIDGVQYPYSKVFYRVGHVFGFKMGHGKYKKFQFSLPKPEEGDKTNLINSNSTYNSSNKTENQPCQSNVTNQMSNGEISIIFYNVWEKSSLCRIYSPCTYKKHTPFALNDDKKLFSMSACISEGDEINLNTQLKWENEVYNKYSQSKDYIERKIDFRKGEIDRVTINYTDFSSLLIKGILSLQNIHHLYMLPDISNMEYNLQCLETIIQYNKNRISQDELRRQFKSYTKHKLEDITGNEFSYLVSLFPNRFFIDKTTNEISTVKRSSSKFNSEAMSVNYFLTNKEITYLTKKRLHSECVDECNHCIYRPLLDSEEDDDLNGKDVIVSGGRRYEVIGSCVFEKRKKRLMKKKEMSNGCKNDIVEYIDLIE